MDTAELHYLTYDPDAILDAMQDAYMEAGGDVLYPGDEKFILLHAMQAIIVQAFAGVDNAIRMATLRYAVGDYLDVIGETRSCTRIGEQAAAAKIDITEAADGISRTIVRGLTVTADGEKLYTLDSDVEMNGTGATYTVSVTCTEPGTEGNGLQAGTQMQFMIPQIGVMNVVCSMGASGGMNKEDDEAYRERIRTIGAMNVTTGTAMQYEAVARSVSSDIIDARAIQISAGNVGVYLIIEDDVSTASVVAAVRDVLNGQETRPLTDTVTVASAVDIDYTINVDYRAETGIDITDKIGEAIAEYSQWQDHTIGQAFNPDRLMALLYNAGCTRVTWGSGSAFNGSGSIQYTEISPDQRCKGTITARRVS